MRGFARPCFIDSLLCTRRIRGCLGIGMFRQGADWTMGRQARTAATAGDLATTSELSTEKIKMQRRVSEQRRTDDLMAHEYPSVFRG